MDSNSQVLTQMGRRLIRPLVRSWSDQKLAEVYAFNADGNMYYDTYCGCIKGVDTSNVLHNHHTMPTCSGDHYWDREDYDFENAEIGYRILSGIWNGNSGYGFDSVYDKLRQIRLSTILRFEMRRRARIKARHQLSKNLKRCSTRSY